MHKGDRQRFVCAWFLVVGWLVGFYGISTFLVPSSLPNYWNSIEWNYICPILPQQAGCDTRSIFEWSLTGLNLEFSFSYTDCQIKIWNVGGHYLWSDEFVPQLTTQIIWTMRQKKFNKKNATPPQKKRFFIKQSKLEKLIQSSKGGYVCYVFVCVCVCVCVIQRR